MKIISWFLTLFILLVAFCFASHNGQSTTINLWPFEAEATMPFYVVSLGTLFLGFLAGLVVGWVGHIPHRMEARKLRRHVAGLTKKLDEMHTNPPMIGKNQGRDYIGWARNRWRSRGKRA
jgi:uncharacterized integral membrane protein